MNEGLGELRVSQTLFYVHPFLRKLCYNSFDDLPLYAVIPVTIVLVKL